MRVTVEGAPVALSPLEYRCLSYVMHHAGRVVPPTELLSTSTATATTATRTRSRC
jgi:DNA-binding response OmpR family regulator